MIPLELPTEPLHPPTPTTGGLLLLTGGERRHRYLAERVRAAHPERIAGWVVVDPELEPLRDDWRGRVRSRLRRWRRKIASDAAFHRARFEASRSGLYGGFCTLRHERASVRRLRAAETTLLPPLSESHAVTERIASVTAARLPEIVRELAPHLIVSYTENLARQAALEPTAGGGIHLHEGWLPEYGGADGLLWPLYHRRPNLLGATVHLLSGDERPGPILERGQVALTGGESPEEIRIRALLLGTELLLESLEHLLTPGATLKGHLLPRGVGRHYTPAEMRPWIRAAILRDRANGWLPAELAREREMLF